MNAEMILENINWTLLKEQKKELIGLVNTTYGGHQVLSTSVIDSINGILNLLDTIQDYAVDELGLPENQVFDLDESEESKTTVFGYKLSESNKHRETLMVLIKIIEDSELFGDISSKLIHTDLLTMVFIIDEVNTNPQMISQFNWKNIRQIKETITNLYNLPDLQSVLGELSVELIKDDLLKLWNYLGDLQEYATNVLKLEASLVFGSTKTNVQ